MFSRFAIKNDRTFTASRRAQYAHVRDSGQYFLWIKQDPRAMSFLVFFVLVCAAVSAEAAAVPEQRDCGEDFRSKVRELMDIKRSCPLAFYESCCQVKKL